MTITPTIITGPTNEPISLAEAKLAIGLDTSDADTLLGIYIEAAREVFESQTGRTVHQQTLEIVLDAWPYWGYVELPRATPLISIESVKYKNSDAVEATMSASDYVADVDSIPGRLALGYGKTWPSFTAHPVSPIHVRYKAGIATASPLVAASADIKVANLLLVAGMFENRESEIVTDRNSAKAAALQFGIQLFLSKNLASYVF